MSLSSAGACPFQVGETFEKLLTLEAGTISAFATFMGDTNPLHHDMELAKKSMFGTIIASGGQTLGVIGATTADLVTQRCNSLGLEMSFRFRRAVLADEPLRIALEITAIDEKPGKGHVVTFAGTMFNAKGEAAVTGHSKTLVFRDIPSR
jgi:3-hydroxybutyryl-CoA dehydratase